LRNHMKVTSGLILIGVMVLMIFAALMAERFEPESIQVGRTIINSSYLK
jgi:hypothetical protein